MPLFRVRYTGPTEMEIEAYSHFVAEETASDDALQYGHWWVEEIKDEEVEDDE